MNERYVIRWISKVNGRAGKGSKSFERSEGEQLVEELNREYPQIQHDLIPGGETLPHDGEVPAAVAELSSA